MKKIIIKVAPQNVPKEEKNAISLFSGSGGDTTGLESASYNVIAFSEHIRTFIETHEDMFPLSRLICHDNMTDIRHIPDQIFEQYRNRVGLIFAGFPCQGFSHAGKKRSDDPRNELVYEFVRVTKCVRPKWIIGENVSGLLSRKGIHPQTGQKVPVINIINSIFNDIGYSLTWNIVNATNFGIPQTRKRLIIIGHDNLLAHPDAVYPHLNWNDQSSLPPPTVRSILEDTLEGAIEFPKQNIPDDIDQRVWLATELIAPSSHTVHPNLIRLVKGIRNKSSAELASDPDQNKTVCHPEGLISFGRRISAYHGEIIDPDKPCKTIICTYGVCPRLFVGLHNPTINMYWIRPFTITELAQIQGYPKHHRFHGNVKEIITQLATLSHQVLSKKLSNCCQQSLLNHTNNQFKSKFDHEQI